MLYAAKSTRIFQLDMTAARILVGGNWVVQGANTRPSAGCLLHINGWKPARAGHERKGMRSGRARQGRQYGVVTHRDGIVES